MNRLLATWLLPTVLLSPSARVLPRHPVLTGDWVNVQGAGIRAKDVLHFGPGKTFIVTIHQPGRSAKIVKGTVRGVPPDATAQRAHVSQIVFLMIDASTGAKLGMPMAEQRVLKRRKDHLAMMSRLFYIPELPALTDMGHALFARRGSETSTSRRFAEMRKRLRF